MPKPEVKHRPRALGAAARAVLRRHRHEVGRRGGIEAEAAVNPNQPAVAVEKLPVGDDGADVRLRVQIVAGPADQHVRGPVKRTVRRVVNLARCLVVRDEHAERGLADLAGQLGAIPRVDDGPGVDEVHRPPHIEDLLPLQKERTQLGEEQWEPPVHLDLGAVGLDLREVGVVREVEDQIRRDAILQVDATLWLPRLVKATSGPVERAGLYGGDRRLDLEVTTGGQAAQPIEQPHLRQEPGDVA